MKSFTETTPISEIIEVLWHNVSERYSLRKRPGWKASDLESATKAVNTQYEVPVLDAWLHIYDEFLSWWVSLSISLLFNKTSDQEKQNVVPVYGLICGAICSHLFAIRKLALSGLEVPAKQVLRSYREYLEVLLILWVKPELVEEFRKTSSEEAANQFWNKYVRRKKAPKVLWNAARAIVGESEEAQGAWDEWQRWCREEDTALSMAAHPTTTASFMSVIVPEMMETKEFWPGFLGLRSEASVRTLRYACASALELLPIQSFPFGFDDTFKRPAILTFDRDDEFHQHVKYGRYVLAGLLVSITTIQKSHPELNAFRGVAGMFGDNDKGDASTEP